VVSLSTTLLPCGARGPLSATGSAETSAMGLTTTLQLLSCSGSGCISARGRSRIRTVRPWDAARQDSWRLVLPAKILDSLSYSTRRAS
jgi:hypothetical protein